MRRIARSLSLQRNARHRHRWRARGSGTRRLAQPFARYFSIINETFASELFARATTRTWSTRRPSAKSSSG